MPHLTVRTPMIVVAVIALNLAVGIALWRLDDTLLCRIAVIGIAIQLGLVRLIQGRGRPFWAGFVVAATMTLASCLLVFPPQFAGGAPPAFGPARAPTYPGAVMWRALERYDRFLEPLFGAVFGAVYRLHDTGAIPTLPALMAVYTTYALVASLPHWAIALPCGLAAQAAVRRLSPRPPSPPA